MQIGDDRVRKSTAQNLRVEYEQINFKDGESVEDFALRLSNIVQRLAILGDPEPEAKVVAKYLRVARPRYKQLVVSIEQLLDISTLSIEEITGRLGRMMAISAPRRGSTTLRMSWWTASCVTAPALQRRDVRRRARSVIQPEAWARRWLIPGGGSSRGQTRGAGGGGTPKLPTGGTDKGKKKLAGDECAYCGKTGHWARQCRKKKRDEQAHAAETEEEAALMMGIATISIDGEDDAASAVVADSGARAHWVFTDEEPSVVSARSTVALATASRTTSSTEVHLQEDKLFVQLGEKHDEGETRWILDTGATNHMTGDRSFFSELDTGVHGTVKFGDGSVVNIEGRGTILFMCKTGEHQQLGGVYFIPKLAANIISLGQLDEDKFKVLIEEGVLRI